MSIPKLRHCLPLLVLSTTLFLPLSARAAEKKNEGFKPLFDGKDFTGWKFFLPGKAVPEKTWSIKDGVIICTGHPNGYFYSTQPYHNYVLRYDWQYVQPKEGQKSSFNSGCLVHIHEPHKVWPQCVEVQGANANHAFLYFLACKKIELNYDQATKDKVTHPIGEWNTTEITCKDDGSIIAKINGTKVTTGKSDLTEGLIGFQAEGAEIHFRNIEIKQLK